MHFSIATDDDLSSGGGPPAGAEAGGGPAVRVRRARVLPVIPHRAYVAAGYTQGCKGCTVRREGKRCQEHTPACRQRVRRHIGAEAHEAIMGVQAAASSGEAPAALATGRSGEVCSMEPPVPATHGDQRPQACGLGLGPDPTRGASYVGRRRPAGTGQGSANGRTKRACVASGRALPAGGAAPPVGAEPDPLALPDECGDQGTCAGATADFGSGSSPQAGLDTGLGGLGQYPPVGDVHASGVNPAGPNTGPAIGGTLSSFLGATNHASTSFCVVHANEQGTPLGQAIFGQDSSEEHPGPAACTAGVTGAILAVRNPSQSWARGDLGPASEMAPD